MNGFTTDINVPIGDSMRALWIEIIFLKYETSPVSRVGVGSVAANPVRQRGIGGCLHCKVCIASRLPVDWSIVDVITRGVGEGSKQIAAVGPHDL